MKIKHPCLLALLSLIIFIDISIAGDTETSADGSIIDSIVIDNQNIFNTDSSQYDLWIFKLANKLHIKTKKFVIRRELLQKKSEIFSQELAYETERNLRLLPFLSNAAISLRPDSGGSNIMNVTTFDSWTLTGGISLRRNSEENTVHLRFEESNLLGLGQYLSLNYYYRNFDDDYGQIVFAERRLLGTRNYFEVFYDGHPEHGTKGFAVGKPFFSLNTTTKYSFSHSILDNRVDHYYPQYDTLAAQHWIVGEKTEFFAAWRFGTYNTKVTSGIKIKYKNMNLDSTFTSSNEIIIQDSTFKIVFPVDSLYYEVLPEFGIYNIEYVKSERINGLGQNEDFALLKGATIAFGGAISNKQTHRLYNKVSINFRYDMNVDHHFFFINAIKKVWFLGGYDFRNTAMLSIKYYNNKLNWFTPAIRIKYDDDFRDNGAHFVYLGENNGLRGYLKNNLVGEQKININMENRFFPGVDLLSANLGLVQFTDLGYVWNNTNSFRLKDMYWALGVGLRIGMEKISSAQTMRFDLTYAGLTEEWQFSFGIGQYFR